MAVLQRREAAARELKGGKGEQEMSQIDFEREANNAIEPLLPIEKKLIAWSLGIGVVSLAILVILNHFVPIAV